MEYIDNDCQIKERYLKRIESTFEFFDNNNTQRVYEAIQESGTITSKKKLSVV